MKGILLTILLFVSGFALAQNRNEFILFGVVKDSDQKEPIPNAIVEFDGEKVQSNEKGEFYLKIIFNKASEVKVHHVGFEKKYLLLTEKMARKKVVNDTLYWNTIILEGIKLGAVTVVAHKVDTVFGSAQYSVQDYLYLPKDRLLLLAYKKTLNKQGELVLTNAKQDIVSNYIIPGRAMYLYKDYAGKDYIICDEAVYRIVVRDDQIYMFKIRQEDFFSFHQRVIDTIGDNFYFSNYNELYPAVKFFVTGRNDTAHHELYEVKDDFMMELYRAQYKYVSGRDKLWAYRQEQETGIDKEIIIGYNVFTQDILYKPIYAPLFVIRDTVLLFDQYKDKIVKFDEYNDSIGQYYMDYRYAPKGERWEQPILKDKAKDLIYAIYNGGGYIYIRELKYNTSEIGKTNRLKFRFIERIKIHEGYVYYIYRPFESSQKKFLYREELFKATSPSQIEE